MPLFTESERVRATNPAKTYCIDPGLARGFSSRTEPGHLLENAVYLELRRRGGEIAWLRTRGGFEVDFVVRTPDGLSLVQVCADPSGEARERELRALAEAMDEHGVRSSTIVTLGHAEEVALPAGTVRMVPGWEWLLRAAGA